MKKTDTKTKSTNIETDVKGLKAMASRLVAAVTTTVGDTGRKYHELKPSVRDSSKLAEDILAVAKVLRRLAKAGKYACVNNSTLFYDTGFASEASEAVFDARLLASGKKGVF